MKTYEDYPAPVRDERTGCLRWQGPHASNGYGRIGHNRYAHTGAWERVHGKVPEGHELDHVRERGCEYKDCVNLDHLEPVTHKVNCQRIPRVAEQMERTKCPQGHPYEGHNLIVRRGRRECRQCTRDRNKRNRESRKLRRLGESF